MREEMEPPWDLGRDLRPIRFPIDLSRSNVPVFAIFVPGNLGHAPFRDVAMQAMVQGILTGVVSLILYGYAVTLLGAASGAAFGALCPVMTALFAIPILGEWAALRDWIGIGPISLGVYFVSGGPLPNRLGRAPSLPSRSARSCYRVGGNQAGV